MAASAFQALLLELYQDPINVRFRWVFSTEIFKYLIKKNNFWYYIVYCFIFILFTTTCVLETSSSRKLLFCVFIVWKIKYLFNTKTFFSCSFLFLLHYNKQCKFDKLVSFGLSGHLPTWSATLFNSTDLRLC